MKITAVICEFNPFHNGHKKLLDCAKKMQGSKLITVMSGDVVQRGLLPVIDKYTRAKHATVAGSDITIELPPQYACAPAEIFAIGGVSYAVAAGADCIAFGSESGDIDELYAAAEITDDDNDALNAAIKENLKCGMSHPSARREALKQCGYVKAADTLDSPNNLLAIEYIKAIKRICPAMQCISVKREGGAHGDTEICGDICSSSAIRKALGERLPPMQCVPPYVYDDLKKYKNSDDRLYAIIKYNIATKPIKDICGMAEGLDVKIQSEAAKSNSIEELIDAVKSKRYTHARIRRILTNIAISNVCDIRALKDVNIQYLNVLAMRDDARDLLAGFSAPATVRPYDKVRLNIVDDLSMRASAVFKAAAYDYAEKAYIHK
ncbi:MAG: nucleotidyltransferase family protein [Clostridia bacterium]|nr:nucleotidyltransferase family protein [Clostridia bacterium]